MPQFVKHETAPGRELISVPLAREDGEVLIATRYGKKVIQLRGTLRANTEALLDTAIDNFKELFSRPEKNLDISWAGGTLRFVATCSSHEFDRDHYHLSIVPWSAEFVVSSGVGKDTSTTLAENEEALTTSDGVNPGIFIAESTFTLSGSKAPAPVITLEIVNADANVLGFEYKNDDTGERIIVTRDVDWDAAAGKSVVIDCEQKRVTDNLSSTDQVEGTFLGTFPRFGVGTNNVIIRTGGIVNQESDELSIPYPAATDAVFFSSTAIRYGISFVVPYSDAGFSTIALGLSKNGTPTSIANATIYTDDGGEPSATSIAIFDINQSDVPSYPTYEYVQTTANGGAFSLEGGRRYWLVLSVQAGTGANRFIWNTDSTIGYPRGSSVVSTDSGSTWTADTGIPAFKIYSGGGPGSMELLHTVAYTKTYL
jgi:hypothetical protein